MSKFALYLTCGIISLAAGIGINVLNANSGGTGVGPGFIFVLLGISLIGMSFRAKRLENKE